MIRIRQIKIDILKDNKDTLLSKCAFLLKIDKNKIKRLEIVKKSVDARYKPKLYFIYEVEVAVLEEDKVLEKIKNNNISKSKKEEYSFTITGDKLLDKRPVIVGSGPSGLFCAYFLASNGYKPIIVERGERIEDRVKTVEKFWNEGVLNSNSNVQFGEGGAGTFSDGKLNTLVKDKFNRQKKILEIFVECGAPKEILYENKPHIGTDILRRVVISLREKIISMGGEFLYNSCMTDIIVENKKIVGIEINRSKKLLCSVLVLSIGHSARDTFKLLFDKKVIMHSKPFAVGVRIEHLRSMIDKGQYGDLYKYLKPASYKFTYHTGERGVYTFCMCPGGYVVNSSSEENRLVINGMSNYKRDTKNSNAAVIVTVGEKDYGEGVFAGVAYQKKLEEKAYNIGKGKIPIQKYGDFKRNIKSDSLGGVLPVMRGDYSFGNLREIFSEDINHSLMDAIDSFDKKIPGFAAYDAILAGVESRTSSPIRIERDSLGCSNIKGLYPCGEGAGYAGGIMSSAVDGILQAENIAKIYSGFSSDM